MGSERERRREKGESQINRKRRKRERRGGVREGKERRRENESQREKQEKEREERISKRERERGKRVREEERESKRRREERRKREEGEKKEKKERGRRKVRGRGKRGRRESQSGRESRRKVRKREGGEKSKRKKRKREGGEKVEERERRRRERGEREEEREKEERKLDGGQREEEESEKEREEREKVRESKRRREERRKREEGEKKERGRRESQREREQEESEKVRERRKREGGEKVSGGSEREEERERKRVERVRETGKRVRERERKTNESAKAKKRRKREWIIPPAKLKENTDYTHKEYIAKIRSDKDKEQRVEYFLTGAGADKPPFNLFVVDHETGSVRVTAILDREKYPSYNLTGLAKFADGSMAEANIPLTVTVLDLNDNPPYFELHTGNISEASETGMTVVMTVQGKDDDQAGTINSELHYTIISQEPAGEMMFTIDAKTGELRVKEPTLDRETYDFYKLLITAKDMGGGEGGLVGTGTVEVKILDINDNVPTLEKSAYTGSVDENVHDVEVMRIKALDADLVHTDNWLAVFEIVKGNEDKLFSIETDKETNEGVLKLIKPVDFEEVQNLDLDLLIKNVAPFVKGSATRLDVDVKAEKVAGPVWAPGSVLTWA
ncbi:hypothetical protein WMY93_024980 [Mugilogobius chulae]|uniref:Cadherin domain-containing protein n=1 Tax=Mugilogobius chulae TaxID=88201 RepID=A0AAW0N130_9GOBI